MKIAIVHDYIKEFGGAERVLRKLSDLYPEAPIYTSFVLRNSSCAKEFKDRKIVESNFGWLLKHFNLYSPLRFLAPLVWWSIDLREYDLIITSCSSFFARGFRTNPNAKVIAYCHTPPRFLYGYETSINLQRFWLVRVYAVIVNHFLRIFDLWSSQRVNYWIVNSENVKNRVWKFYRKEAVVVYPPVNVEDLIKKAKGVKKEDYFLIVSRLVGAKGIVEATKVVIGLGYKLKISGEEVGFSNIKKQLLKIKGVELLGRVGDAKLAKLYAKAKGFIALAKEEDFGITPVESMAAGTPVIAFNGGGFKETVIDGETGILVNDISEKTLQLAVKRVTRKNWKKSELQKRALLFSEKRFLMEIKKVIKWVMTEK
jgi:glycosyltransferase involved in cell wall biosynthesis